MISGPRFFDFTKYAECHGPFIGAAEQCTFSRKLPSERVTKICFMVLTRYKYKISLRLIPEFELFCLMNPGNQSQIYNLL